MLIKIADKEFNESELETLAKAGVLHIGQKNDPASTTLTAPALHGPWQGSSTQFGLFSYPGVRPQRFSALSRPDSFWDIVSLSKSDYTNEILEILTGQTAAAGTNAASFCGNPPVVGNLKTCQQTYSWGDYYIKTNLNAGALIGQRRNRADVPAEIINAGPQNNPLIPEIMFNLADTRSQLAHELYLLGVDFGRQTELVGIQGTAGTQNSTYIGWFTQFRGLDGLIRTGHTDAVSGYACGAVDSAIVAFNANITGTAADGSGRSFVEALTDLVRGLKKRARQVGMGDTQFAIVMRAEQFSRVTDVWACDYTVYRCAGAAASPNNRGSGDGMSIQALRLSMVTGQYLLVDGIEVPVVFSEGIPNPATAANTYNADIYVVPVSYAGMPLLRAEYFPMDNQYTTEYMNANGITTVKTMNNGLFLVGKRDTGMCLEWHFQARMRLILEVPFLAGRLDDAQYTYYEPTRQAIPGASLYVNGGVSYRPT